VIADDLFALRFDDGMIGPLRFSFVKTTYAWRRSLFLVVKPGRVDFPQRILYLDLRLVEPNSMENGTKCSNT
jgi:hypothetical protein